MKVLDKRCTKCHLNGHYRGTCDLELCTVTKEDVDWCVKTFYEVKAQMEREVLIPKRHMRKGAVDKDTLQGLNRLYW
jgi:hypothetical protein